MTSTRTRTRLTAVLASLALSLITLTGLSGTAQAAEAPAATSDDVTASTHGCPRGAVCIYPGEGWNGGNPTYIFYSYGVHKVYDQWGWHRVFNNQYGRAYASACKNGNGTQCRLPVMPGTWSNVSMTLINSFWLFTE